MLTRLAGYAVLVAFVVLTFNGGALVGSLIWAWLVILFLLGKQKLLEERLRALESNSKAAG